MQFGVGCDCALLEDVGVAWLEATTTYGIDGPGHPWTNNTVSETSVKRECGRIYGSLENSERQSHVFGEIKACTEAAFAAEEALKDIYVWRGDEGDHKWISFCSPLLEHEAVGGNANDTGPLAVESLKRACGGALWPKLNFSSSEVAAEILRLESRDGEEGNDGQVVAWSAAVSALCAHGVSRLTYFRPIEDHDCPGCVFPHFIVGITRGGSITGVCGLTVWT